MKAAVLWGPQNVRVEQFPEPPMHDDCVKIAVAYCGLCGTDFHKFAGKSGSRPVTYPVPLGHEASGVVVEIGKNVTRFKVGDRVTVDPNWSCGKCYMCHKGKRHLCKNSRGVVKGMAEFICPPEENVHHIPDGLSLRDAALAEPLSCCLHGIDLLDVHMGDVVVIIGMGAIGLMMLQLCAKASAGKIIVVEPIEEKRETALKMGAALFINPQTQDVSKVIKENGIECVDRVLECVGLVSTAQLALEVADPGATVVLFGVADNGAILPVDLYQAFTKELTIKTSYINPGTMIPAIDLLEREAIKMDGFIQEITLEELPEELKTKALSRKGKVVVRIS
ncbi:MAG: zinc-dependent alcohol dehydrogenase family protein [Clostridia bacterium]|nr:zinc-dependent alcohol dehydrogenase family protein [Clostridia bacterium]